MRRRVAAAQLELVGDDREGNLERALALARKAVAGGAQFVCFPECMTSDYTRQAQRFAEPIPGPSCEAFLELARKSGTCFLIGLFEREGGHIYNTVAILGPDGLAGRYRKRKLWVDTQNLEGLDDPAMFAPGDLPNILDFGGLRVGILICWDGQYDEVWEGIRAGGARVIFYPNNRGTIEPEVVAKRAKALGIPIVGVNRVGLRRIYPPDLERTKKAMPHLVVKGDEVYYRAVGDSAIIDAQGTILAHNAGDETLLFADLSL
jgi:predicted amidohydrolase